MRWLAILMLAYIVLGLQVGLGAYIGIGGAAPNLVLLAVVFIALNAPREAALAGGFALGLVQDLFAQQPLGLYAVSYGLGAMAVEAMRHAVQRRHAVTHFSVTLVGGAIVAVVLTLHGWIHPAGAARVLPGGLKVPAERLGPGLAAISAIYTAILAVPVLWLLDQARRVFGFHQAHRTGGAYRMR